MHSKLSVGHGILVGVFVRLFMAKEISKGND